MNKTNRALVRALVVVMLATVTVHVSVSAEAQAPQKRVVKIDESTGELVDISQAQEVAPAAAAPGIVIMNNQKSDQASGQVATQATKQQSSQAAIQDQPTNVIEDTPLNASAADRRRRDRQNLEMQTEQKIVEKLEDARMEDERSRSERLFNKGFSSKDSSASQPVQVIQAPVVVKEEPKVNVREEVRAALEDMKPKSDAPMTEYYIQGLAGLGEYPDASNMKGKMALGFSVGVITPERVVAEGTFQYSQYDIDRNSSYGGGFYDGLPFKKLSQYNVQGALKYQLLGGKFRPVVGVLASYTYRGYEFQQYGYTGYGSYNGGNNASTNSFDVGALAGLDVQITNTFSIGADVRYFKNVAHRENSDYANSYSYYQYAGKRVEEFNYYIASIVGRFTF